jgi:D-alanyl-D-alanine dipeptidase
MATLAAGLPTEAAELRRALLEAMTGAGFVNYPYEWWHYSFGDRYWAYVTGAQEAIYGGI